MRSWETVFIARDKWEADVIRQLLDSCGIPARLRGESLGELYGLHTGPLAQVKIEVPPEMADEAMNIIDAEVVSEIDD